MSFTLQIYETIFENFYYYLLVPLLSSLKSKMFDSPKVKLPVFHHIFQWRAFYLKFYLPKPIVASNERPTYNSWQHNF